MARTVLGRVRVSAAWLVLLAAALAAPACATQVACSGQKLDAKVQKQQQALASGPLYQELFQRYGKPAMCVIDTEDGRTTVTYTFGGGVRLISTSAAEAEFTEQRVEAVNFDTAKALDLLKRAEKASYGSGGCGISWTDAEDESEGGVKEIVYRGDTCNCQARLIYKGTMVATLLLRSAC